MIKYLIAFMLLASQCIAGIGIGVTPWPGPGMVVVSGSSCPSPIHTATWTAPSTYISEWNESYGSATYLTVSSDTLLLSQATSDNQETVILRDTASTLTATEHTAYFEYKISAVTGFNVNDKQDIFGTRSNEVKIITLALTSNASGTITGLRLSDTTDAGAENSSFSPSANTWYDFYVAVKYSSGANDGYAIVKYREHGTLTWIDGPAFTNRVYGASTTMDFIGIGMFFETFWSSGTVTSNFDNWSLREGICSPSSY